MTDKHDYSTTIKVDKTPQEAFDAINNVRGWWGKNIEGNSTNSGDEFIFQVEDVHFSKQKLVEVIPEKKVVWLVTDSRLDFIKDKSEWTGTKINFEISEQGNKTQVRFTHIGLLPEIECYNACSNAWRDLVTGNLQSLITTGKDQPMF
ncbi:MAG: SRPBCC domain-containing protein [Ignavibacteriota bacterium]